MIVTIIEVTEEVTKVTRMIIRVIKVIVHGGRHSDIFEGPQAPDSTASYTTRGKIYTPLYPFMRMFYQVFSQTFLEEISKIEG